MFFFLPTVLDRMDPSMRMMREETIGPVAPMMSFSTDEEALKLANASRYGLAAYVFTGDMKRMDWFRWLPRTVTLAAYVFTGDMKRGLFFAERLEAGSVGVNTTRPSFWGPLRRMEGERLGKGAVPERLVRVHGREAHPDRSGGGDLRVRRRGGDGGLLSGRARDGIRLLEMGRTGLINEGRKRRLLRPWNRPYQTSCYSRFCPY